MIRKLHFIWVDKYDYNNTDVVVPTKYRKNAELWKQKNPNWEVKMHTMPDLERYIEATNNIDLYNVYSSYKNFICKLDMIRLLILYYEGGLYMDLDIYPSESTLDELFSPYSNTQTELILTKEPYCNVKNYSGVGYNTDKYIISNAWIYSCVTRNTMLLKLLTLMVENSSKESTHILLATGPPIYNQFYTRLDDQNKVKLLEPEGILQKTTQQVEYSYSSFDNSWCTSKVWNQDVFNQYYFYSDGDEFNGKLVPISNDKDRFIPKIIHQIWLPQNRDSKLPIEYINSWKEHNPSWQHMLWTVNNVTPDASLPESIPLGTRILLTVLKQGGIVVDCATKCLRPIPDNVLQNDLFFCYEKNGLDIADHVMGISVETMQSITADIQAGNMNDIKLTDFISKYNAMIYPDYYFTACPRQNTFLNKQSICYMNGHDDIYTCLTNYKIAHRDNLGTLLNTLGLTGEGAEIGVLRGEFSRQILRQWKGKKLYMVDCWQAQDKTVYVDTNNVSDAYNLFNMQVARTKVYKETFDENKFELIRGFSVPVSQQFTDSQLDFIYIDARHDYEGVLEDLEAWYPKVKSGGIISGHDYIMPEHREHVNKFGKFEVNEALHQFIQKHDIPDFDLTHRDNTYISFYFVKP